MTPEQQVNYMLADCFLAAGQGVGSAIHLEHEALAWWRDRYRVRFLRALTIAGNVWEDDRDRLLGVSRFVGFRAAELSGERASIDRDCAIRASEQVEAGCQIRARMRNEAGLDAAAAVD